MLSITIISMPYFSRIQKLLDKIALIARENLKGVRVIRAFSNQNHEVKRFNLETKNQKDMEYYIDGLNIAIESIVGKKEEKGISTLFSRGGTNISTNNAPKQEFELISYMVVK